MEHTIILKPSLLSPNAAHFAGGKWALQCCAQVLAGSGTEVHVTCCAKRSTLLAIGLSGSCPGISLSSLSPAGYISGLPVASWVFEDGNKRITYMCLMSDEISQARVFEALVMLTESLRHSKCTPSLSVSAMLASGTQSTLPTTQDLPTAQHDTWLLVDADDSQLIPCRHELSSAGTQSHPSASSADPSPQGSTSPASNNSARREPSLFESLVQSWQRKCLALVQNVHFLPFGPSGTANRTPGLLQAWSQLGGILCVSKFVASYLQHWWPAGLHLPPMRVVPLSAFGCFGHGPFRDFGPEALRQLEHAPSCFQPSKGAPVACPHLKKPCLGVLKLTPEKGSSIVLALAQQLHDSFDFLVVAGDPKVAQVFGFQHNVKVIEPQEDIDAVLSQVCLLLVPSLWLEAWGMVVTEAMLRGVPCIVSNAGGLPEAGLGVCPVCPVEQIDIPLSKEGTPCWALRRYKQQDIRVWIDAINTATQPQTISDLSTRVRAAAHSFVEHGVHQELPDLLDWLKGLGREAVYEGNYVRE